MKSENADTEAGAARLILARSETRLMIVILE
jgi:hypothetical protein